MNVKVSSTIEEIEGWKAKSYCIYNENNFNNYGFPLEEKNFQLISKLIKEKTVKVLLDGELNQFWFNNHSVSFDQDL